MLIAGLVADVWRWWWCAVEGLPLLSRTGGSSSCHHSSAALAAAAAVDLNESSKEREALGRRFLCR